MKNQNHRGSLIIITILSVVIFLMVLGVAGLVYALFRPDVTTTDMFDIRQLGSPCSSGNQHCLCKQGNPSQKICFQSTEDDQIQVSVPMLHFSQSFTLSSLSTDEDKTDNFHVLQVEYGAFKHPTMADTICFRKTSDPNYPQRLCYTVPTHSAFLTGPTKIKPETI